MKQEKPGLTYTQYKDMIWKLWKKSPDNPLNQVSHRHHKLNLIFSFFMIGLFVLASYRFVSLNWQNADWMNEWNDLPWQACNWQLSLAICIAFPSQIHDKVVVPHYRLLCYLSYWYPYVSSLWVSVSVYLLQMGFHFHAAPATPNKILRLYVLSLLSTAPKS